MKEFIQSIADDVKDIFTHDIETTKTYIVPGRNDPGLTFGYNQVKRGKFIETCVLFIDIRNSTIISRRLKKDKIKLGKIYSAFVDAMTSIADRYGYVRNIIGDRVMVVFEPSNCFTGAVNCAAMMYTTSQWILRKYSGLETFKVGIGIEFGEMLILKTGIQKKHEEQSEYKNLAWVGDAANLASKLTDFANKDYNSPLYKITYSDLVYEDVFKRYQQPKPASSLLEKYLNNSSPTSLYNKEWVNKSFTVSLNVDEFNQKIEITPEGWQYDKKKMTAVIKENRSGTTLPVLMSGKVYNEFKKADPKSPHLKKLSLKQYPNAPYTGTGIYGGYPSFTEITQIKL